MRILIAPSDTGHAAGDTVAAYDFYRPADPHAPWLRINMVASVDGIATDDEGLSGGLGGAADMRAYRAQRALADVILVGAGTVRAEGMGPHKVHESVAARRREDGRRAPAAMAVVSRSLRLDPRSRLFAEAVRPTVVITCAAAPAERRRALEQVARVVVAGDDTVDPVGALAALRDLGLPHVLCEGGPRLNADLLRAGVVDELCLTVAPRILATEGLRIVTPARGAATAVHLDALAQENGELFCRWRAGQNNRSSSESSPRSRS